MTADPFTPLADAFVLGALDDDEARQFLQHLSTGCPICQQTVAISRRLVNVLPYAVEPKVPPPELKRRLLNAVASEEKTLKLRPASDKHETQSQPASIRPLPSRTFYQRVQGTLAWAAVFLLIAMTYAYFAQRNLVLQLRQRVASLEQAATESRAATRQLEAELARQQALINRIKAPSVLLVELRGLPIHPSGRAKVFLDPRNVQGSIVAYNLPPLTTEHDYQLWFIKDGKPFDAGVFHVNEQGDYVGEVQHLPESLAGITAFAVTREPQGGRQTPTLDQMYLMGTVQGG
jgi:anti-sigma-K factor RskA